MKAITTREDAINFIHGCILFIGPGFHPDTPMVGYDFAGSGPMLTQSAQVYYQDRLDECHEILGESIYDVGLEFMQKLGDAPAIEESGEKQPIDWNAEVEELCHKRAKAIQYINKAVGEGLSIGDYYVPVVDDNIELRLIKQKGDLEVELLDEEIEPISQNQMAASDWIELAAHVQKAIAERGEGK